MEEAKQSLYRAQQELLARVQAAEAKESQRAAKLAAAETAQRARQDEEAAAQRARQAQEAAAAAAKRREMEESARQACGSGSMPIFGPPRGALPGKSVVCMEHCMAKYNCTWELHLTRNAPCTGCCCGGDSTASPQRAAALLCSLGRR